MTPPSDLDVAPLGRSAKDSTPRARFTFRGNVPLGRHGWLRLTPAYSVRYVRELLDDSPGGSVLDPFCGTGTTLLACAERGIDCTTVDLNPFLVWLANAKAAAYESADIETSRALAKRMAAATRKRTAPAFVPPIHRVDRWWDEDVRLALGRAFVTLRGARGDVSDAAHDLATVAFCRTLIEVSNASFGHQSMSFRKRNDASTAPARPARVVEALAGSMDVVAEAARSPILPARRRVVLGDSRAVHRFAKKERYTRVITSPPYPNRMSYVRELRPYMYWLGYLLERGDAGELDWKAIGGTWGAATSRLATWAPDPRVSVPYGGFRGIVKRISAHEPLLGNYVHRYFEDMVHHVRALAKVVAPGASVHYVVGNSKFYDVMLPVEAIFASLFEAAGFDGASVTELRKRTSKAELFEYLVEARAPGSRRKKHPERRDAAAT